MMAALVPGVRALKLIGNLFQRIAVYADNRYCAKYYPNRQTMSKSALF